MRVEHDRRDHRFVVRLKEGEAELVYQQQRETMDLVHTFVPEEGRGRQIGEALVTEAMSYARQNSYSVKPSCAFVRTWLESHPEQRDLVTND